jgi:S1-C subfamily serine protease
MRKLFGILALCMVSVVLFAGCSVGTGANHQNLSYMIERVYPTVVSIEVYESQTPKSKESRIAGSGVVIYSSASFCLIATNAHVLGDVGGYNKTTWNRQSYSNVWISVIHWSDELRQGKLNINSNTDMKDYTSKQRFQAASQTVLYDNLKEDLAIIKYTSANYAKNFTGARAQLRPATASLRVGEPIAALGYSLGLYYYSSTGTVTQLYDEHGFVCEDYDEDTKWTIPKEFKFAFMHDATTIQGNSGGPVFDVDGKVLGLTTMIALADTTKVNGHTHGVPAIGFSIAMSARHIHDVVSDRASAWGLVNWA